MSTMNNTTQKLQKLQNAQQVVIRDDFKHTAEEFLKTQIIETTTHYTGLRPRTEQDPFLDINTIQQILTGYGVPTKGKLGVGTGSNINWKQIDCIWYFEAYTCQVSFEIDWLEPAYQPTL